MCDPLTIAATTAVVAGASKALAFKGQMEASEANRHAANMTAGAANYDQNVRASQVDAQESENSVQALIDAAAQRGAISASASALGASQGQLNREQNAADFASGRALSISQLNSQNQRRQIGSERGSTEARRQSTINSVQKPGALSLILGIADAGLQGANAYSDAGGSLPGTKTASQRVS